MWDVKYVGRAGGHRRAGSDNLRRGGRLCAGGGIIGDSGGRCHLGQIVLSEGHCRARPYPPVTSRMTPRQPAGVASDGSQPCSRTRETAGSVSHGTEVPESTGHLAIHADVGLRIGFAWFCQDSPSVCLGMGPVASLCLSSRPVSNGSFPFMLSGHAVRSDV